MPSGLAGPTEASGSTGRAASAIIGAVTEAIDRLGGMSELGDRFVQYRLPAVTDEDEAQACRKADGRGYQVEGRR